MTEVSADAIRPIIPEPIWPAIRQTAARIIQGPHGSNLIEISFAGGMFAFEHDSPERRAAIKRNFGCDVEEGSDGQDNNQ